MREPTTPGWAREEHLRLFCILRNLDKQYRACIGATAQGAISLMEWNYESVRDFLERNPYYAQLFDEYEGKFACVYNVNGIGVHIYNVGGRPEIWFGNLVGIVNQQERLNDAVNFVRIAYQVLTDAVEQINRDHMSE